MKRKQIIINLSQKTLDYMAELNEHEKLKAIREEHVEKMKKLDERLNTQINKLTTQQVKKLYHSRLRLQQRINSTEQLMDYYGKHLN